MILIDSGSCHNSGHKQTGCASRLLSNQLRMISVFTRGEKQLDLNQHQGMTTRIFDHTGLTVRRFGIKLD